MDGEFRDGRLQSRAFASAVLLEKIVRGAYENRRSSDVQPLQWSILRYLSIADEERCTIIWIASFLGVTHAPIVRAIKTLERRNFIEHRVNPADARSRIVRLSSEGMAQLNADPLLSVADRIDLLADPEKNALISAVRQLIPRTDTGQEDDA